MSDHGHHDPGGHELEAVNTKSLFRLMGSLSVITLLASLAVIQWFYSQRRALQDEHNAQGSFQLQAYQANMDQALQGVDGVAKDIAANPKLLAAPAPPSGWVHPDDLVGGGAAAPAEGTAEPAAPSTPAQPAEAEGDAAPAEGDAAEGADAPEGEKSAPEGDAAKPAANEGNDAEGRDEPAANGDNKANEGGDKPADQG